MLQAPMKMNPFMYERSDATVVKGLYQSALSDKAQHIRKEYRHETW